LRARLLNLKQACLACLGQFADSTGRAKVPDDALPLRAELFSALQMEQHGRILANAHHLSAARGRDLLLSRLAQNETVIIDACNLLTAAIRSERQIAPAAEWLLDNFYLIEEQIRTAKRHLPKNYSEQLPRLASGADPAAGGWPRVYDIALSTIAHGDGRIDPEGLASFVSAYQQVATLKLGELWAIPIMLRLALIENLRRVAARLACTHNHRNLAAYWSEKLADTVEKQPNHLILLVADMARSEPPMESAFVAELVRRLQGQSTSLTLPLTWLEQRLAESGQSIEHMVQQESQQQAADQVSISNSIGSLRLLSSIDWREFVESMSAVETCLRQDPGAAYCHMDFATRDLYRHAVEKIAKQQQVSELSIAQCALRLAQTVASADGGSARHAHIGYYLVGKGARQLQQACALDATRSAAWWSRPWQALAQAPLALYLCGIVLLTLMASGLIVARAYAVGASPALLALLGGLALIAGSQLALALVNWLATLISLPRPLPRMDFSHGIADDARTLVVVPAMLLPGPNALLQIESLCEALEVRFLANRDANLRFCLLTDYADADHASEPDDAALLAHIQRQIVRLNSKYQDSGSEQFFLLHRPRRWNEQEQVWMGYERKRGKLADLNAYLRQPEAASAFELVLGQRSSLGHIRYVITLDTDTGLPRDAARKFVATMAHPLNRPLYDPLQRRVVEGYGILQPRIAVSLPGANASRYELLCGGEAGIDPYTRTVSDVYQDLFGEGSFIGKGIYEVDVFEQALGGRMPENRILSHDLLEGCYARAGLLNDVQLHEQYPSSYRQDMRRRHRWIRGDWQIASWLLPSVPGPLQSRSRPNPLSPLSRWKLFDNLRRSLVAPALVGLLLCGWLLLPPSGFWSGAALTILLLPALFSLAVNMMRKSSDMRLHQHLAAIMRSAQQHLLHVALSLVFLPFEAASSLDAIVRTHWRIWVAHRRLLEWTPSGEAGRGEDPHWRSYWRSLWINPVLAVALAGYLSQTNTAALPSAAPILLLWALAPLLAWWISQPVLQPGAQLTAAQGEFLQLLARKTWLFFETHVTAADHWLPLDNVQEYPVAVVARRTSPTNIGLALLANLTACDFGYITVGNCLTRCHDTLHTLSLLERHQGHFYNWYDTQNLQPLQPIYVSSVDSGNLAGHLLTLRIGLLALADAPMVSKRLFPGLLDTWRLLSSHADAPLQHQLKPLGHELQQACAAPPQNLSVVHDCLQRLLHLANVVLASQAVPAALPAVDTPLSIWGHAFMRQCRSAYTELLWLAPWLEAGTPGTAGHGNGSFEHPQLVGIPTLRQLAQWPDLPPVAPLLALGSQRAAQRLHELTQLARQCNDFAHMEYGFLYDPTTHLLAIGYNVTERRRDVSYYDLLASEARLACFIGIAQGQLPQESWFALGRQLTVAGGQPILLSWSGSMFEYLMPLLVMPDYPNTLLFQTCQAAVVRQIEYGQQRNVPWGISESGYNAFDASLNYQYRAFGVPGLGFKRGLGDDLVIAPYASMMALMVLPEQACANLQAMAALGFEGKYGFYEAIDYTPARQPRGQSSTLIRSFMTHHQGMGFLSLAYFLLNRPMQARFESDPLFQATLSLLHEKIPKASASYCNTTELADIRTTSEGQVMPVRMFTRADARTPEVQLLSNGRYHLMVTSAGGSCSRWQELMLTRWREDGTRDHWGAFCYIRDLETGRFWSTTWQPTLAVPDQYEVIFSEGRAEFRRSDNQFSLHTEIVVSPEDDIELRRTRIVNLARQRRTIDITSYAEVVLAPSAADAMHPAFSNLFVQTEILPERHALLCTRRPRSAEEKNPWMFHLLALHGAEIDAVSYETDRMQFIGRGQSVAAPHALQQRGPLSNSQGSVLDPIVAIRYQITLDPEQSATIDLVSGIAASRAQCLELVEKYQDRHLAERVAELSWTHSQVMLRQLNASESDAQLYGRLANSVLYLNPLLRADAATLMRNQRGQSGLWSSAISGDLPIVLVQIKSADNFELVRQMVQAHAYWRLKGLAVDLVLWNGEHNGYRQLLQEQIMHLISAVTGIHGGERPGGIFVRTVDQISVEDRILFQAVARVVLSDSKGSLIDQINRRELMEVRPPRLLPNSVGNKPRQQNGPQDLRQGSLQNPPQNPQQHSQPNPAAGADGAADGPASLPGNGLGAFSADGREYVIHTSRSNLTPAPWSNVLANPQFGSVVSESGQAYTWGENAHEFRLTPWDNDPVCDGSGEAFYLRDEDSTHYWSPTPLPCRGQGRGEYTTRHGFGYSVFEHREHGIESELTMYVALDAAIKYTVLRVKNTSAQPRRLSATGYVEWVLGDLRAKSAQHIVTEIDAASNALLARNPYNSSFSQRTAFFDVDSNNRSVTADRLDFIGRNRALSNPVALERVRLSGKVGAGLDPCAALQVAFELEPGQQRELVFMLGLADTRRSDDVSQMVRQYRGAAAAAASLQQVHAYWRRTLGVVKVNSPDPAFNVLANGWLLYQTIACRMWARSGYYQSGGAFGFRDQLQDAMALVHCEPGLLREQLLLCAAHQFVEGDVQHWWHPPGNRGVRTRCSDDFLWLPLALQRYVSSTGDSDVLDQEVPFIEGRILREEEDSYYDLPQRSEQKASLYQHAVRAIEHGMRLGTHGLVLMGSCDWNDGMDKVGIKGKGESVWLSFFLYQILQRFIPLAILQRDPAFAEHCQTFAASLRVALHEHGWDGQWYRRAYFDDGSALGSAQNAECQIDSIAQSWSVLSGAADSERAHEAMQSLDSHLVRRNDGVILLLDPPFDKSTQNPGYIRGYVPGVRENGGQYTHAAIWAAMAFADMGDSAKAWELLQIINPVNHGNSAAAVARYKVEPYVIAADVYGAAPHVGRGGWTWYTGSAGWMYRLMLESILGVTLHGDKLWGQSLQFKPCLPAHWDTVTLDYLYRSTQYRIEFKQGAAKGAGASVTLDGVRQEDMSIALVDDGREHLVQIT
jgi:cellobiose phosphorylase